MSQHLELMRHIRNILLILSALITAVPAFAGLSVHAGVPLELARDRKSRVSNLIYNLHFDIPADTALPIKGEATIMFDYKPAKAGSLLLDFRPGKRAVSSVKVNGKPYDAVIANEHIAIPDAMLKERANALSITFTPDNRHLNRRPGYLYTLFVPDRARTAFPCFDQPDMKAQFHLSLTLPEGWKCVSNSPVTSEGSPRKGRIHKVFAPTEPLSTYLFAFAAGEFSVEPHKGAARRMNTYHRETDPKKIAQLQTVMDEVEAALKWQDEYTGVAYPFAKYDLVVLPGFQFGGMEHTGATFYNDRRIFLGENPTPDELLSRSQLIAHETTHMWFGDYVTMAWFNDVWTKEVFANFYAAAITRLALPQFDHDLTWLRQYKAAALSEDRSEGRTSIRQQLDNLNNAGLVYNQIIYNKAPLMMAKLQEIMGEDPFRQGIRDYVRKYAYGNATWPNLVECLQAHTDADLREFSRVWVDEKGMPEISVSVSHGNLVVRQSDPLDAGNLWPQQFCVRLYQGPLTIEYPVRFSAKNPEVKILLPKFFHNPDLIIPNSDAKGYGLFTLKPEYLDKLLSAMSASVADSLSAAGRLEAWMDLNENYLAGRITDADWVNGLLDAIALESDPLAAATFTGYLSMPLSMMDAGQTPPFEHTMLQLASSHSLKSVRTALLKTLVSRAHSREVCDSLMAIWQRGESPLLNENDFMQMAWELAVRYPDRADDIIATQRARISNPDRIAQFDFISPAVSPRKSERDAMFARLLTPAGRAVEPWAGTAMSLLNHTLRQKEAVAYIRPALDALPQVQATGDIFFPGNWCAALLGNHRSAEARAALDAYLRDNASLKQLLKNKVLNGAYCLLRAISAK